MPAVPEPLQQQLGVQNVVAYRPEVLEQGLVPRQLSSGPARGLGNEEIARELRCAEVTEQRLLTQLSRVSAGRSRTALNARLHAL